MDKNKKSPGAYSKAFFNKYGGGPCPDKGGVLSHPAWAGLCSTIGQWIKTKKAPKINLRLL
jgi:hypothetical protein